MIVRRKTDECLAARKLILFLSACVCTCSRTRARAHNKSIDDKEMRRRRAEYAERYNTIGGTRAKKQTARKRCIVALTWHSFSETVDLTGRLRGQQHLSRPLDMNDGMVRSERSDRLVNLRA